MDSSKQFSSTEMMSTPPMYLEHWNPNITLPDEMEGFRLENIIGSGSIGQVYSAIQTKQYAVKVIQWSTNSVQEIARHEYETGLLFNSCGETLHSLNYYEQEHRSFIIMEYGIPCLSYYSGRECSMRDILNTVLRVSKALEAIHSQGYTHFDVKPENIMMVKGEAKLADFSHCSQFLRDQIYNRPIGTGTYMAPEIFAGGKHTGKEDMYSLGISMYALLMAGRMPFDLSKRENQRRACEDTIESLFIHPELLKIIQRASAFDANDRYTDIKELSSDIHTFMNAYEKNMDEEMPLYRMCPSLQQTVFPSVPISWDDFAKEPHFITTDL